ncbi:IS200/IS605 family transposase [Galactobacillus timonensis]|uniref:IS200/IS605 family transposase n=1 Tax=Galactobacillus timonensis TaxID=2041840 RepID=UPI00240A5E52|nr:IS200/IS605 family transposase [Galactobacillus timonensis]MDD6679971.1 IS200/IS605 family transposase [Galactobacillus timonensis]
MQGRVYTTSITILFGVSNNQNILITSVIETSLQELLKAVGEENGFSVDQCEVGEADHVHCFVSAPPKLSITFIVKHLKGVSGLRLFREYPELRQSLWHGQLWNGSYFVETIGSTSEENVRRYIDQQKNVQR